MRPPVASASYMPGEALSWARTHRELLERVVEDLLKTGCWPEANTLSRQFAREGAPVDVRSLGAQMPRPLGFLERNPDRIVLLLFGLRMTHTGHKLLAGFAAMLRLAVERYAGNDNPPLLTRADAARGTVDDDPYVTALSEVVLREAPFLGSGFGGAEEHWTREITADVTRYWRVVTAEDYLRSRADELMSHPQFGWQPAATVEPQPGPHASQVREDRERRDLFISHASEDKVEVARPLALELRRFGFSVWLDEDELVVGDSLSESIDWGLAHSDSGVVVLSRAFFGKPWPRRELRGLVARETASERPLILPVWHGIDHAFLVDKAPTLADLLAADTADGIPSAAAKIARALERRSRASGDATTGHEDDAALRGGTVELLRARDPVVAVSQPDALRPLGNLDDVLWPSGDVVRVRGWALDPEKPDTSVTVIVELDGHVLTSALADRPRPDVSRQYGVAGDHGFLIDVEIRHSGTLKVKASSAQGETELGSTYVSLPGRS